MSRRRRRPEVGPFAMLPVDVLTCAAVRTLPHVAHRALVAMTAQYHGGRNGSLTLTRRTAKDYGLGSPATLAASLSELEARGLILRTRPGTRVPPRSAMFAVTWRGIDEPLQHDRHDVAPAPIPTHAYARWTTDRRSPHWTVTRRAARYSRCTSASSAGVQGNGLMSSAGVQGKAVFPVAQVYGSQISIRGAVRRRGAA